MSGNEILIKIDRFDGPLALLLHLIQKEQMRIEDLDLTHITNQYLDYLKKMQDLNFDIAGEYLFMAATLVHLKSETVTDESLFSHSGNNSTDELQQEIQTRGDLIRRLEELERFQQLGQKIWDLPKKGHEIFVKPKVDRKEIENSILTPIDLQQLTDVMMDLMRRDKKKYAVIKRDRLSIKEKLSRLKTLLKQGETVVFDQLLDEGGIGIIDKVITFISILELARLKKLQIFQNGEKGPIYVEVKECLDSFDPETANGFESEEDGSVASNDSVLQSAVIQ